MAESKGGSLIRFLGVGRNGSSTVNAGEVLASFSPAGVEMPEAALYGTWVENILGNGRLADRSKRYKSEMKLDNDEQVIVHCIPCTLDSPDRTTFPVVAFVAVVSPQYGADTKMNGHQLIEVLRTTVQDRQGSEILFTGSPETVQRWLGNVLEQLCTEASYSKMAQLRAALDSTTELMRKNVEAVLERGEKLEDLQSSAEELETQACGFKEKAHILERQMCWQKWKTWIIVVLIIIVILIVIIAPIAASFAKK